MEVVKKMAAVLCSAASSPTTMPAQSSNTGSTLASSTGSSYAAAGSAGPANSNNLTGHAVSRSFVLAVLGRLNVWLAGLHGILQQQAEAAARPAAMWRQVQCWMQQLQSEAAAPEDYLALQLAALL